jgi:hypothetical protein
MLLDMSRQMSYETDAVDTTGVGLNIGMKTYIVYCSTTL